MHPTLDFDFEETEPLAPAHLLPSSNLGVHWGTLFPLGSLGQIPVNLGLGGYLPVQNATRIEVADASVPQFYRYQAQSDALSINLGVAIEPHSMFALGAGVHVLGGIIGGSRIEIDLLSRRFIQNELEAKVAIESAPILGVTFRPLSYFTLSASVRGALHLPYELNIDTSLTQIGRVDTTVYGRLFPPQKYILGSAWQGSDRLYVTAEIVWERWSQAPDPSVQFTGEVNIDVLGGETQALEHSQQDLGAVDTSVLGLALSINSCRIWRFEAGTDTYRLRFLHRRALAISSMDMCIRWVEVWGGLYVIRWPTVRLHSRWNWLASGCICQRDR